MRTEILFAYISSQLLCSLQNEAICTIHTDVQSSSGYESESRFFDWLWRILFRFIIEIGRFDFELVLSNCTRLMLVVHHAANHGYRQFFVWGSPMWRNATVMGLPFLFVRCAFGKVKLTGVKPLKSKKERCNRSNVPVTLNHQYIGVCKQENQTRSRHFGRSKRQDPRGVSGFIISAGMASNFLIVLSRFQG